MRQAHRGEANRLRSPPCSSRATGRCSRARTRRASSRRRSGASRSTRRESMSSSARRSFRSRRRCRARTRAAFASTRRTCTGSSRAPFTGEVSAPMLLELGVKGPRRPLRAPSALRRDRRHRAAAGRGCARGGPPVIACVGETEAEREAGETEAVLERQVGVIPRARAARRRLRACLGDRHGEDGDTGDRAGGARIRQVAARVARALRRLGEAGQRRVLLRNPTWTARSSEAPRSTARRSRRSAARRRRLL